MECTIQILLADNGEIINQTMADYLRDSGHSVDRVHDGHAALSAIEELHYDLALVDMRISGMNGLSLLKKIQESRPEIPIVVITEYGDMDLAIQALRIGVVDFLTKPVKLLELDAVLEKSVRIGTLINRCAHNADSPPIDHGISQEQGKAKHRTFFTLVAVAFIFALLTLSVILFIDRDQIAERLNGDDLQAEIAKRKLAEARLWESERLYHILSENTRDVVWITDMDLRPTYVNPAVTRVLGYDTAEAMTLAWEDLCEPECLKDIKDMFINELSREDVAEQEAYSLQTVQIESVCRDGSATRVEAKCASLRNLDKQPVGFLVIFHKTDEKTQSEHFQTLVSGQDQ